MYFIFGYANSISALTAEKIANEALSLFYEEQILAGFVANDYEEEFAEWGDVVRATYPVEMTADRVPEGEAAPVNSVSAGSHLVPLNQRISQAFTLTDREQQRSFQDLSEFFFRPAVRSMAKMRDRIVQGELYHSWPYTVGNLDAAMDFDDIIDCGTLQTEANVPASGRNILCGARIGGKIRKMDEFTARVSEAGDDSLVRTGFIGDINGYAAHETNSFTTVAESTYRETTVDVAAVAGGTSIGVADMTGTIIAGSWAKVDGVPYRIASHTGATTPTAFVIDTTFRDAVALSAVVRVYTPSVVNHPTAGTYAIGYEGKIGFDGGVTPKIGQGVTFGTTGSPYSVIKVDATDVWLNRPLDVAVANDASMFLMPGGNYGAAIARNSIQMVNRPLAVPVAGQGVLAATVSGGGWSMRVMSEYNMLKAETTYMLDFIMGVKKINPQYNVLILG